MSYQQKLYSSMCKCMLLKDSIDSFASDTEAIMEDDISEILEYFDDILYTLMKYMPSFIS